LEGKAMTKFLTLALAFVLTTGVTAAAELSGVWTLSWQPDFGGNDDAYDCTFRQTGLTLTVNCRDDPGPTMTGEIDGQKIVLHLRTGRDGTETATLTGELNQKGTTITGAWRLTEQNRIGKFVATKR
jgi:hypothetical protein